MESINNEIEIKEIKRINKIRRKNAKIYPIYKMFSWDLLFFYSIEFLFYTITKKVDASEILIIYGLYLIFGIIMQIPAVTITDFLGKRNSIILGNFLIVFFGISLIFIPGALGIIIGDFIFALGYAIKTISESNLLYDSVATHGGEGLYSKLDARGGSLYYILDGVASLSAGYLFVINNYLPIIICICFAIISTIISFGFKDIYINKKKEKIKNKFELLKNLKEYNSGLKESFKFIIKSRRMKAFILFEIFFLRNNSYRRYI